MKHLILLIIIVQSFVSLAQTDTTKVPFVAYWSIGDSYDFKITKVKQKTKDNILVNNDTTAYKLNFLVIDSTETSYTIKWSYKTDFEQMNIPLNMVDAFSKYDTTNVIYKTNELGQFIEIVNWKEISDMMQEVTDILLTEVAKNKDLDETKFRKIVTPLLDIYKTKQGIEQILFKEIQYFHYFFGLEYSTAEPLYYEQELPNMFGGKPIRGDVKLYFESVDFDVSFCVLIQEMKLNENDTKDLLTQVFKKMKINDKKIKKELKLAQFEINDTNRFEFYFYPGVPNFIETKRVTLYNMSNVKSTKTDITKIELLD